MGLSVPTGSNGVTLNGQSDQASYALQRSSGTWDLRPSITFATRSGPLSGGVQLSAITRIGPRNDQGYLLGDEFDATTWLGISPTRWLTFTGRVEYQHYGQIHGSFGQHLQHNVPEEEEVQADFDVNGDGMIDQNDTEFVTVYRDELQPHVIAGPEDLPANSGGAGWLVGLGLSARIPAGPLTGDTLSLEWLEPIGSSLNGIQLGQGRTLAVRFGIDI
jgi:hypothetical protein